MEWIILDDGTEPVGDLFAELSKSCPNIRYIRQEGEKTLIGAKRNAIMKEARGDIFVWMDDDDYYFPERVAHSVTLLQRYPKIQLAGSSHIFMYYFDTGKIHSFGPLHQKHATNGTMAIRKEYARTHTYDETVTHAEEKSFLDDYKHDMVQLDPYKTMLVMAHSSNTYDKRIMRDRKSADISGVSIVSMLKETTLKLKDFIRTGAQRSFYEGLKLNATPSS
jgi:glycosyltransferase involved in cell wall biosynthesis